jgi:hypothetical protein
MSQPASTPGSSLLPIAIRPAVREDAEGIARVFLESAEHHASLDPLRYAVPSFEAISERYRDGKQHPRDADGEAITLVAEFRGAAHIMAMKRL